MRKTIISSICLALLLFSCNDFLDRESPSKINETESFKSEKDLELYTNMLLDEYIPGATELTRGDQYSDYVAVSGRMSFLQANFSPDQQGGWSWTTWRQLYRTNLLLKNMVAAKENVSDEVYRHYEGVARFWRASFYFEMTKKFGDLPWYDSPIDPDDHELMYKARDSREFIMHKILEDITYATENCFDKSEYLNNSLINKYVALALKSRICLYEGTYRKYHSVNPSTNNAWSSEYETSTDFLKAAVDASQQLMTNSPYSLAKDMSKTQSLYRSFFNSKNLNYTETIWGRQYDGELARHDVTLQFNATGNQSNRISPTKEFVNTYLNLDGTPFTRAADYATRNFQEEFKKRDHRLAQTIMGLNFSKKINGIETAYAPNLGITLTGYQVIKFNIDDDSYETVGNSYNSLPIFRMGEIVLNYAEAKAELGEFDTNVWNVSIRPLRERAGVVGNPPTAADPYLVEYFDNSISDMYLLEVRRERAIELFFEGQRWDDLMRWRMGDLFRKSWSSMYIPAKNTVYDLTGNGATRYAVVDTAPADPEVGVIYIDLSKRSEYTYDNGYLIINNSDIFWETKKYMFPLPTNVVVKNPNLGQNFGWAK